jgi:hypothetical protein
LATVLVHKHRGCLVAILRAFLHEPVNPQSGMAQAVDELGEQAVRAGVVRMDDCSNRQDLCRAIASVPGLGPLWESCGICRFLWRSERIAKTVAAAGRVSDPATQRTRFVNRNIVSYMTLSCRSWPTVDSG